MKNKKAFIISILISIAVGIISALCTRNNMEVYENLVLPPLSPPSMLFPIVWSILYILMGISAYIIYVSDDYMKTGALKIYAIQLLVNFIWTLVFFNLQSYFLSILILVTLIILVIVMISSFMQINKTSAYLQYPYLFWIVFACYLNMGIFILNM